VNGDLLSVRGLSVSYGPVSAVRNISLRVGDGEIVALLGPNGAGKTSVLRGVTGLVPATAGRVRMAGHRVDRPSRAVGLGIAHVPEGRRVFPGLSVSDNLLLGGWGVSGHRSQLRARRDQVFEMFPRLGERQRQLAGQLSGGEQQMLAIGRALMTEPRLLLIDELSLGLAPMVVDTLIERLVELNKAGMSLLLIEQFVHRALGIADRVYMLSKGRVVFEGTPDDATKAGAVEEAYLLGAGA
jgi:branched-chain amino acid transport system ATP-binding protein